MGERRQFEEEHTLKKKTNKINITVVENDVEKFNINRHINAGLDLDTKT